MSPLSLEGVISMNRGGLKATGLSLNVSFQLFCLPFPRSQELADKKAEMEAILERSSAAAEAREAIIQVRNTQPL
jgi:hypothetical protein